MEFDSGAFGYFFDAVDQSASIEHGFRIGRVMSVPWAWQIIDKRVSRYGWVVQLWDGRRTYLEYVVDEVGRRVPERLTVRTLAGREIKPELGDPDVVWFEPRHVNACLAGRVQGDALVPAR
jgi:hypothetical protein